MRAVDEPIRRKSIDENNDRVSKYYTVIELTLTKTKFYRKEIFQIVKA